MIFSSIFRPLLRHSANKLNIQNELSNLYSTMVKAAVMIQPDKPFELKEIARQTNLGVNDVRLKVQYSCVDTLTPQMLPAELPFVPGYEIVGEVIEVGSQVKADVATIGESIVALSLEKYSGLAEECVVDAMDVFRIPGNVKHQTAVVLPYSYATALYAFSKLYRPTPKEKSLLLISCGAAGRGIAALDIAHGIYKAKVIGISDTEERTEIMRQHGAFAGICINDKQLQKRILKRTEGQEVDYIFDAIGEDNLKNMVPCLKMGGSIISAQITDLKVLKPPPNTYFSIANLKHLRDKDPALYRQMVLDTLELADHGVLKPHICCNYPLDKINEAMQFIADKKSTGKILIKMY